jgi:hypothetical protein
VIDFNREIGVFMIFTHGFRKNERGIPIVIFDNIIRECGFEVTYKKYCDFQPLPALARFFKFQPYNNIFSVMIDSLISNALPRKKNISQDSFYSKYFSCLCGLYPQEMISFPKP